MSPPREQSNTQPNAQPAPATRPKRTVDGSLPYSDIDVNAWRDYPHIETGSLWTITSRERSNGHSLDYHGNCVPQILTQLLTRFTRQNDVILDMFLGSGTSAIEAMNLNRRAIGIDIQPNMVEHVRNKLAGLGIDFEAENRAALIAGDSADAQWTGRQIERALKQMGQEKAQFLFLHPPYDDIIKFSDIEGDLSNVASTEMFLDRFEAVCRLGYDLLEPGRFAAVVIGDKYANQTLIPLGFYCMDRMNRVGFQTKSIIVKNMSGNEKAKGRTDNLWRYRALKGGFYIFKHEYILLFRKPPAKSKGSQGS